jgi:seryl-tRNA synthetase
MLKGKGEDASAVMAEVAGLGDELKRNEEALADLLNRFNAFLGDPQPAARERAGGPGRGGNVEVLRWGTPREFASPRRTTSTSARRWAGWISRRRRRFPARAFR